MGYSNAGFEVVGVDLSPQPSYPFEFVQADIRRIFQSDFWRDFDAIHVSPPCPRFSTITVVAGDPEDHPNLIPETRDFLTSTSLPWVIENVPGAPLLDPLLLCGSMFHLSLRRHRLFEANFPIPQMACIHRGTEVVGVYGHSGGSSKRDGKLFSTGRDEWARAMGIDWMTMDELAQAIPPAYTTYIGQWLMVQFADA